MPWYFLDLGRADSLAGPRHALLLSPSTITMTKLSIMDGLPFVEVPANFGNGPSDSADWNIDDKIWHLSHRLKRSYGLG